MKPLKTPRFDVPSRKIAYNLFCKDIRKIKKELLGVPVSKANAITSKEWEKVKASDKKMKMYRGLYKEEKRRHEEALQIYQEDHMDEWRLLISTKGVIRRPERPHSLKNHQSHPNQMSLKNHQSQAMEKRSLQKHE